MRVSGWLFFYWLSEIRIRKDYLLKSKNMINKKIDYGDEPTSINLKKDKVQKVVIECSMCTVLFRVKCKIECK